MNNPFKVGDKIVYHKGKSDEDFGVITRFGAVY
jgi:hypothetical protein